MQIMKVYRSSNEVLQIGSYFYLKGAIHIFNDISPKKDIQKY